MRIRRLVIHLQSSLWLVPVLCVLAGAVVSFGTIALDRAFDYGAIPQDLVGGPDAAAAVLSTVAASMVSLTALVLTITMVVVQLAMGQFSPRIVQRILRDRPSGLAIGLFVATFVHAILALREVTNEGDGTGQVPGIAVATAFVLVLASVAVLVVYVHHLGQALRVSALIELVGTQTRHLIGRVYGDGPSPAHGGSRLERSVPALQSGVITVIAVDKLVAEARRAGCRLELLPARGEFVPAEAPLFRVHGEAPGLDENELREAVILKPERTLDEDVAYGLRLLVDIAERSLSDSPLQDPTTAVQAIDRLHDILRQLLRRPLPDGRHRDEEGVVRLTTREPRWEDYVHLAFEEIQLAGACSPPVVRRLRSALDDLLSVSPDDRRAALEEQLVRLTETSRSKANTKHGDTRVAEAPSTAQPAL